MIKQCMYCSLDTAGNHEAGCPNMPQSQQTVNLPFPVSGGEGVSDDKRVFTAGAPFSQTLEGKMANLEAANAALKKKIVERDVEIAELERERDQLRADARELALSLCDAALLVADWGSYASDYFKEKHGYKDDLKTLGTALSEHAQYLPQGETNDANRSD